MPRAKVGRGGARVNKRVVVLVEEELERRYGSMLDSLDKDRSTHIREGMWKEVEAYERKAK